MNITQVLIANSFSRLNLSSGIRLELLFTTYGSSTAQINIEFQSTSPFIFTEIFVVSAPRKNYSHCGKFFLLYELNRKRIFLIKKACFVVSLLLFHNIFEKLISIVPQGEGWLWLDSFSKEIIVGPVPILHSLFSIIH